MWNAAVINRRHESRNIANHPATETNDKRLAIKSRRDHPVANRADLLKCFRFLACRNRDQRRAEIPLTSGFFFTRSAKSGATLLSEMIAHIARGRCLRTYSPDLLNKPLADQHAIAMPARTEGDQWRPVRLLRRIPMFRTERSSWCLEMCRPCFRTKVMVSACKSQNSALILCATAMRSACRVPPGVRLAGKLTVALVELPAHEATCCRISRRSVGAMKIVEAGDTIFSMLAFKPSRDIHVVIDAVADRARVGFRRSSLIERRLENRLVARYLG